MSTFEVLRKAKVEVRAVNTKDGRALELVFADGRTHCFDSRSRESELLDIFGHDMKIIAEKFDGGTYSFLGGQLVDYRDASWRGFVHSDESIQQLVERVGLQTSADLRSRSPANGLFNRMRGRHTNGVFLGGEWDKFDLSVPNLGAGGEFENRLLFRWSPFTPNIQTSIEVERLICSNGMIAMSPLVTFEVPVIDNWESNLDVVAMQLKPRVNQILADRFEAMEQVRASVGDVQRAHRTLGQRMDNADDQSYGLLKRLTNMTDVDRHLSRYYQADVFKNGALADRADSHMSQFALYNVLTEAASHTQSNGQSDNGIQMAINRLVFDEADRRRTLASRQIPAAEISNPERAFFSAVGDNFSM